WLGLYSDSGSLEQYNIEFVGPSPSVTTIEYDELTDGHASRTGRTINDEEDFDFFKIELPQGTWRVQVVPVEGYFDVTMNVFNGPNVPGGTDGAPATGGGTYLNPINQNVGNGGRETWNVTTSNKMTEYFVRVDGYGTNQGTYAITVVEQVVNPPDVVIVLPAPPTVFEGSLLPVEVVLDQPSTVPIQVNYSTGTGVYQGFGNADQDVDFVDADGVITFQPGETSQTVFIETIDDNIDEEDPEFLIFALRDPVNARFITGAVSTDIAAGIKDNDSLPAISIADASVAEGDSSENFAYLELQLSRPSSHPVQVSFATSQDSATPPSDYVHTTGTVTFAPGETVQSVVIPIVGDTVSEPSEFFDVVLSSPVNSTLSDSVGRVHILDDEPKTFVVRNTNDSGTDSLRQVLTIANNFPGRDIIRFEIPGSGVRTINLLSPLPAITESVVIDGWSQTGFVDQPLIELKGTNAGAAPAFHVLADDSVIRGFVINDFQSDGILLEGASRTRVQGNYIGTNASGTATITNKYNGVLINNVARDNIIGVDGDGIADDREGNLIAGNNDEGITIWGAGTQRNRIAGNILGADRTGQNALGGNHRGVFIGGGASENIIGTNGDGNNDQAEANLISGNVWDGVGITGSGTDNNIVAGNLIGPNADGKLPLANNYGVRIDSGARGNIVGTNGDGSSDAIEGNVISGNRDDGILILGTGTNQNLVAGNIIGLNSDGTAALPNQNYGVTIRSGAFGNLVGTDGDGVSDSLERNLISANRNDGILIRDAGTNQNRIAGNYIGLDVTGGKDLGNIWSGVAIGDGAQLNVVGTNRDGNGDASEGNVISGNGFDGVSLFGSNTATNFVLGNLLGTDASGTVAIGNSNGILLRDGAEGGVIGGPDPTDRNVISGNRSDGIELRNTGPLGVTIWGNFIGTDITGNSPLPNGQHGILLQGPTSQNGIGGTLPELRNIISGNQQDGIHLAGTGSDENNLFGNFIGVSFAGTQPLPNQQHGLHVSGEARDNRIGGLGAGEGNLIASNLGAGVRITHANAVGNAILGNSIFGNGALGIDLGVVGPTPNDSGDGDPGPNLLTNYPVIHYARRDNGELKVSVTLS
ncbi:MAG: hypothetical protein KDA80_24325, partial [Planctomycetaceae bacterium]|nr:hypothetical protein [Planctomycetaceae bacterium]